MKFDDCGFYCVFMIEPFSMPFRILSQMISTTRFSMMSIPMIPWMSPSLLLESNVTKLVRKVVDWIRCGPGKG